MTAEFLDAGAPPRTAQWRAIGVAVELVVTEPAALGPARRLLEAQLAELDLACSRFRPDSEVMRLSAAGGRRQPAGRVLLAAVAVALRAAADTDGLLDPTLGTVLADHGYDRDFADLRNTAPDRAGAIDVTVQRRACWRDVRVGADWIEVPAGIVLDLGATAKAYAADRAARAITQELGCGALVGLGGDIAVAGPAPTGGWVIEVSEAAPETDLPPGCAQLIAITDGGLATSSTGARRWAHGGSVKHHILDPRTLAPAASCWRTVTVAAGDAVAANTASTAAIIRGDGALAALRAQGLPARLVGRDGRIVTLNGWPDPDPGQTGQTP